MADHKSTGVRVKRPAAIGDGASQKQANPDAGDEVELVSTQMLKQILSSRDPENRRGVTEAAHRDTDGVLARDPRTGYYTIIGEAELKAIVDSGQPLPKLSRPDDPTEAPLHDYADSEHLSLVSVEALRQVLGDEASDDDEESAAAEAPDFDPYLSQS
ncbi:MAG: hypothetical protein R3192_05570 [Woeseiaceae bacterium]|nr:hypothetical protein [Woeseiaceae bacterium]